MSIWCDYYTRIACDTFVGEVLIGNRSSINKAGCQNMIQNSKKGLVLCTHVNKLRTIGAIENWLWNLESTN